MCTLIVAASVWSDVPLVVAANRDEDLSRPAAPPTVWDNEGVSVLAPRDRKAGGTWLGVNAFGVFVGITNRFSANLDPQARSRGQMVLDALRAPTAAEAALRIGAESPARHNPFHLILADTASAHLVWNDGATHHRHRLQPGIHVVTERSMGAAPSLRLERLPALVQPLAGPVLPTLDAWQQVLRHRDTPPLEGVTVLDRSRNYGTRSSTIVQLSDDPQQLTFLHADGPPDEAPFEDASLALRGLLQAG